MLLRGPEGGVGPGEASLGPYCGNVAREKEGEALARKAACGAIGGARGLKAGPCGGDLANPEGAVGADTVGRVLGGPFEGGGAVCATGVLDDA